MENKTVIISGGCGLLGSEFAKTLKEINYRIIVIDNNLKGKNLDPTIGYFNIDITDEDLVKEYIKIIYDNYGIDILINCAAINNPPKDGKYNFFEHYSLHEWKQTLDVNLTGSFLLSRECIKYMLNNKSEEFRGTIINIASDLGIIASDQSIYEFGYNKPPDYGVSKAGLIYLTKYIAGYYEHRIKSVCLAPGSVFNNQSPHLKKSLENRIPLGQLAKVNEYNEAIKFLCSDGSNYMQGQTLIMDGGRTIW